MNTAPDLPRFDGGQLIDITERCPRVVALFGGYMRFYRCLNYAVGGERHTEHADGASLIRHNDVGSGFRREYSLSQLRMLVLRKLLGDALDGASLPHSLNVELAAAVWDSDLHAVEITIGGGVLSTVTLFVPADIWEEVGPPT